MKYGTSLTTLALSTVFLVSSADAHKAQITDAAETVSIVQNSTDVNGTVNSGLPQDEPGGAYTSDGIKQKPVKVPPLLENKSRYL